MLNIDNNLRGMLPKKRLSRQKLSSNDLENRSEFNMQNRHRICKIMRVTKSRSTVYKNKLKRCTKCAVYYSIPDMRCPCCNILLRGRRRDKVGTKKHQPYNDTRLRI